MKLNFIEIFADSFLITDSKFEVLIIFSSIDFKILGVFPRNQRFLMFAKLNGRKTILGRTQMSGTLARSLRASK